MSPLSSFSFWFSEDLITCNVHLRGDQAHKQASSCCGKGSLTNSTFILGSSFLDIN